MLHQILKQCTDKELSKIDDTEIPEEIRQKLMSKPETEQKTPEEK
jgi:hypothetical protein